MNQNAVRNLPPRERREGRGFGENEVYALYGTSGSGRVDMPMRPAALSVSCCCNGSVELN